MDRLNNSRDHQLRRLGRGIAWAFGICLALLVLIKAIEYPADRHRRVTEEAVETIRRIARTPVVDFADDTSQRPEIKVYIEGPTYTDPPRRIGRAYYDLETMQFKASFARTDKSYDHELYDEPREMTVDNFAREVENRAISMLL